MSRIAVFIATTRGPARITGLIPEDPDLHSVMCRDGTSEALPISRRYDAFVRRPTGLIQAMTGHTAYRMDVSDPIDDGDSFQLGVYLAHALFKADRLALGDTPAAEAVWVTGAVKSDLSVLPVAHIPAKIESSKALFDAFSETGRHLGLILPRDNLESLDKRWLTGLGIGPRGHVWAAPAGHVDDALARLGLKAPQIADKPPQARRPTDRPRDVDRARPTQLISRKTMGVIGSLAVLLILSALWYQQSPLKAWRLLAADNDFMGLAVAMRDAEGLDARISKAVFDYLRPEIALAAEAVTVRPPDRRTCAAILHETVPPRITARALDTVRHVERASLCRFVIRLQNPGETPLSAWLGSPGGAPIARTDLGPGGRMDVPIPLPANARAESRLSLRLLAGPAGADLDAAGRQADMPAGLYARQYDLTLLPDPDAGMPRYR